MSQERCKKLKLYRKFLHDLPIYFTLKKNERLTQLPISFHCHSRWLLASLIVIGRWLIVSFLPSFVCRSRLLKKKRTTLAKRKSINQQSPLRWLKDWPPRYNDCCCFQVWFRPAQDAVDWTFLILCVLHMQNKAANSAAFYAARLNEPLVQIVKD